MTTSQPTQIHPLEFLRLIPSMSITHIAHLACLDADQVAGHILWLDRETKSLLEVHGFITKTRNPVSCMSVVQTHPGLTALIAAAQEVCIMVAENHHGELPNAVRQLLGKPPHQKD